MPRRNLHIILIAALVAILCHGQAKSRHGRALSQAFDLIRNRYVEPIKEQDLFVAALKGMTAQLDDHSRYFSEEDYKNFEEQLDKHFTGIGISVRLEPETGELTVISPILGSPALEAGLRAGDVILTVDGKAITGLELDEMVKRLKGPPDSMVELEVLHAGAEQPETIQVVRAAVLGDSVMGDTRHADGQWNFHLEEDPRIGYIRVNTFGDHTLQEFRAALATFKKKPIEALILDLRGNAGGRLEVAIPLCDMFIDKTEQYGGVIVSTRGRNNRIREARVATAGMAVSRDLPIAMLVDGGSASASEIFAACLQDYNRATIIGTRTYGKGTVQELIPLADGESELKLTTATYHRPNESNIDKGRALANGSDVWGVSPNDGFAVELSNEQLLAIRLWRDQRDVIRFSEDGRTIVPSGLLPAEESEQAAVVETEAAAEDSPQDSADETVEETLEETAEIEIEESPSTTPPVPPLSGHPDPQLERAVEFLQSEIDSRE